MMQPYSFYPSDKPPFSVQMDPSSSQGANTSIIAGKRVVIVEDEGITQMQLRRMLKGAGLTVLASAINGAEGVEVVLRERPDLVLMDISMPGSYDGLEAARRILSEYHVCIVMVTAFSDDEYRKLADEINACGYVVKPVTAESLLPQLEVAFHRFDNPSN